MKPFLLWACSGAACLPCPLRCKANRSIPASWRVRRCRTKKCRLHSDTFPNLPARGDGSKAPDAACPGFGGQVVHQVYGDGSIFIMRVKVVGNRCKCGEIEVTAICSVKEVGKIKVLVYAATVWMCDAPFVRFRFADGVDDLVGFHNSYPCVVNDSEAGSAVAKEPVFFFERQAVVSPFVFVQSFAVADGDFVSSVRKEVIAVFVVAYDSASIHHTEIPSVVDSQVVAGYQSECADEKRPRIDAARKISLFSSLS